MGKSYTKKEAIHIVSETAKEYDRLLNGLNYLFIYRNRNNNTIEYFETVFEPRHYQHLTGIELVDTTGVLLKNSVYFYNKCLDSTLTEQEIQFKEDGTTSLKLEALPQLVHFLRFSKMTTTYNGTRPRLYVERLVGTINYCLGFNGDGKYYVPSSCLLEDIRNMGEKPFQILAVFSKSASRKERIYKDIRYVAKGVSLDTIGMPVELQKILSLENYKKIVNDK